MLQEHTFATISMLSGLSRVRVLQAIFDVGLPNKEYCTIPENISQDPVILEELDFLYKSDCARKMVFYFQVVLQILSLCWLPSRTRPRRTGRTSPG